MDRWGAPAPYRSPRALRADLDRVLDAPGVSSDPRGEHAATCTRHEHRRARPMCAARAAACSSAINSGTATESEDRNEEAAATLNRGGLIVGDQRVLATCHGPRHGRTTSEVVTYFTGFPGDLGAHFRGGHPRFALRRSTVKRLRPQVAQKRGGSGGGTTDTAAVAHARPSSSVRNASTATVMRNTWNATRMMTYTLGR